jgi:chemotaxis signal transduction protein
VTDIVSNGTSQVRLLRVGPHTLGVREDAVLKVIDWTTPTPLPFSPNTVSGIVSVQGRMFTVVDLRALLEAPPQNGKQIIALRGDEQLALAVDDSKSVVEVNHVVSEKGASDLFEGKMLIGEDEVSLLNPDTLFAEVIRGRERRRRRL